MRAPAPRRAATSRRSCTIHEILASYQMVCGVYSTAVGRRPAAGSSNRRSEIVNRTEPALVEAKHSIHRRRESRIVRDHDERYGALIVVTHNSRLAAAMDRVLRLPEGR